jgi:hypothetical protein
MKGTGRAELYAYDTSLTFSQAPSYGSWFGELSFCLLWTPTSLSVPRPRGPNHSSSSWKGWGCEGSPHACWSLERKWGVSVLHVLTFEPLDPTTFRRALLLSFLVVIKHIFFLCLNQFGLDFCLYWHTSFLVFNQINVKKSVLSGY